MTQSEARQKTRWYKISPDIRKMIEDTIELGKLYVTLPNDTKLNYSDHHDLHELGYYIFFNKATNSHEIRW